MPGLLLTCGYLSLFLYLIGRLRFFGVPGLRRRTIGSLFLLKVAAGTMLWWVYTFHYTDRSTADIYKFFNDGNVMFSAFRTHPVDYLRMLSGIGGDSGHVQQAYYSLMNNWHRSYDTGYYNDAHTMIRYSALVRLFSFGVFHVHTVFSAFLSLIGLVALYKAFIGFLPKQPGLLMAGIFLWPSVLFWGSAPIKETLLFLGLGLFLLGFFRLLQEPLRWKAWLLLGIGLMVQLVLKSYVLGCMLPGLVALWWCRRTGGRKALLKFTLVHLGAIVLALGAPYLLSGVDLLAIIQQKRQDMLGVVALTDPGSYIPTVPLSGNIMAFIMQVPHALYLSFLSPFTTWNIGALGLTSALENLALVIIPLLSMAFARPLARMDPPLLLFCLFFCLALGILIGWTTPVVGALVRYRVPLLPFYAVAFLLIADPDKLARWRKFRYP